MGARAHKQSHSLAACQQTAAQSSAPTNTHIHNEMHQSGYSIKASLVISHYMYLYKYMHTLTSSCRGTLARVRVDALESPQ